MDPRVQGNRVRKLHLDTDLGGDIDDLCALAMVLHWPAAELLAVTTVAGDQGRRAGYARYALDLAGRADVPVAAGAGVSPGAYRPRPGYLPESRYWPEPIAPLPAAPERALALLRHSVEQGATIVAIGPFTNLALLEQRAPGILRHANLYLMGGYVFPPRDGYPPFTNEMDWNVQVDVTSARLVLQRADPTLIPLTVTVETWLRKAYLPALRAAGPLAQLIARQAEAFAADEQVGVRYGQSYPGLPGDIVNFQHDPLACAIALGWNKGVETREVRLQMALKDDLLCQRPAAGGKPTRVVTRVDGAAFSREWLRLVTGAAPVDSGRRFD